MKSNLKVFERLQVSVMLFIAVWSLSAFTFHPPLAYGQPVTTGHWKFADMANDVIPDISGNGRDATNQGGVLTADGVFFDGINDYAYVNNPGGYDDTAFTIEVIFKTSNFDQQNRSIASSKDGPGFNFMINRDGIPRFFGQHAFTIQDQVFFAPEETLPANEWRHAALVYDGTMLSFYVNYIALESKTPSGEPRINTGCLIFGAELTGSCSATSHAEVELYEARISSGARIPSDFLMMAAPDEDGDSIPDDVDNCPIDENPGQEDFDNDGTGDACEILPITDYTPSLEPNGDIRLDHRHNQARIYWTDVLGLTGNQFIKPASQLDVINTDILTITPQLGTTEVGGGEGYGVRGPGYYGEPGSAYKHVNGQERIMVSLDLSVVDAGGFATAAEVKFRVSSQGATARLVALRHGEVVGEMTETFSPYEKVLVPVDFGVDFDALLLFADEGGFSITNPTRLYIHSPESIPPTPSIALLPALFSRAPLYSQPHSTLWSPMMYVYK